MGKDTVSVSDLQKVNPDRPVVVTRRGKTVGFFFPASRRKLNQRLAKDIQATIEEMSDENVVKAVNDYKSGKMKFVCWKKLREALPK